MFITPTEKSANSSPSAASSTQSPQYGPFTHERTSQLHSPHFFSTSTAHLYITLQTPNGTGNYPTSTIHHEEIGRIAIPTVRVVVLAQMAMANAVVSTQS